MLLMPATGETAGDAPSCSECPGVDIIAEMQDSSLSTLFKNVKYEISSRDN